MIENGTKAITSVVEALKSQPLLLVIALINFAVIGFLFYSEAQQLTRAQELRALFERMFQTCLQRSEENKPAPPAG